MPVVNFMFTSVDARRYLKPGEKQRNPQTQIQINHELTHFRELNDKELLVEFRFAINMTAAGQPIGSIKFEGALTYAGDAVNICKQWHQEKKPPQQVGEEILNRIMGAGMVESVGIARVLGLPPPFQVPQVKIGQPNDKQPYSGMEFG